MPTTCRICNGLGKAPAMPEAGINFEMDPCPRCQGSGQELTVSDVGAAGDASGEPMPDPQELARIGEQRRKKMLYDASLRGLESEEQQTRDLQDKLETGEPMDIAWQLLKEDEASLATADTVIPEEYAFDYYGTNPYTDKHFGIGSYTDPNDPTQRIKIPFYQRSGSGQGGGGEGQPVGGDWAPFFGFDIEGGNFSGLLGGVPQSNKAGWQIKPGDGTTGHALEGFDNTMSRYGTKDLANLGRWLNENVDPARFGESQYTDKAALNQWLVEQGARVDDVARGVRRDKPGGIPWKRAEPMDLAWQLLKDGKERDEWGMKPDAKVTRCVECNAPFGIYDGDIEDDWICDDCLTEMGYES